MTQKQVFTDKSTFIKSYFTQMLTQTMATTQVHGNILLHDHSAFKETHALSKDHCPLARAAALAPPRQSPRPCDWFLCLRRLPWRPRRWQTTEAKLARPSRIAQGPRRVGWLRAALMALHELFSHPVERGYRAGLCSKAALFLLLAAALTYIPPLLVAFRSHGEPAAAGAPHSSPRPARPRPAVLTASPPPSLTQAFG